MSEKSSLQSPLQQFSLELISYDDSLFTNAHDVVSPLPVHDGRGTFSHLGVRMEGLESSRHWNLKHEKVGDDSGFVFYRDHSVVNTVVVGVKASSTRALVHFIELDTSFYTRNPTKDIYSIVLVDELEKKQVTVAENVELKGDTSQTLEVDPPVSASKVILRIGEGGLARIKVFGEPLPPLPKRLNVLTGSQVFGASDASYGEPSLVLRDEREGKVMAGWESCRHSARHRLGLVLSKPALVSTFIIDTYMHCLNPFRFMGVLGCSSIESTEYLIKNLPSWRITHPSGTTEIVPDGGLNDYMAEHGGMKTASSGHVKYQLEWSNYSGPWKILLPIQPLRRDTIHEFTTEVKSVGAVTHLMLVGVPDGGIHRIVAFGEFAQ